MPRDGGSPIEAAEPPKAKFIRGPAGVEVARLGDAGPTQERIRRGPLNYGRVYHPDHVYDSGHGTEEIEVRGYRAPDLMAEMLRHETITLDMAQAGRAFRSAFRRAQLNPLKALDPGKIPAQPADVSDERWLKHREAVAHVGRTLEALGGFNAPASRAAWYVLGCEMSIRAWARRERWGNDGHLSEATARRVVYATLEALTEIERERRR